jgi:hypothetical protein
VKPFTLHTYPPAKAFSTAVASAKGMATEDRRLPLTLRATSRQTDRQSLYTGSESLLHRSQGLGTRSKSLLHRSQRLGTRPKSLLHRSRRLGTRSKQLLDPVANGMKIGRAGRKPPDSLKNELPEPPRRRTCPGIVHTATPDIRSSGLVTPIKPTPVAT